MVKKFLLYRFPYKCREQMVPIQSSTLVLANARGEGVMRGHLAGSDEPDWQVPPHGLDSSLIDNSLKWLASHGNFWETKEKAIHNTCARFCGNTVEAY